MRIGHHEPRRSSDRRRPSFLPRGERLEARQLLAIDLANIAGSTNGSIPGPYGVLLAGLNNNGGVGFSVAEVGDVNGDGYQDFVVGAPTISANGTGVALGGGIGGQAFLVFGSQQVGPQTFDFLTLTPDQRIGDLSALGNAIQNNPVTGAPGFNFNGLTFTASQNPTSALGASVSAVGDVNGDGFADFMIGAPGANDSVNAQNAAGRAYLVYGGPNLVRPTKTVDLDNPSANTDLNILTFVNNAPNAATGRSVASAGDIIPDGLPDIAIGAPNGSFNGLPINGGVYVISGTTLRPARTQTIDLSTVGQGTTGTPGVIFTGANSGDAAGFSIAPGGNFAAATVNAQPQGTLLIGAPQFNVGTGQAYVIYAAANILGAGTTVNGFTSIPLSQVNGSITGAVFTGDVLNDQTGYSVATAGDFNTDGIADIMIGSPGFGASTGRVNVILGRSASVAGPITGIVNLSIVPSGVNAVEFDGQSVGSLAGFSISAVGNINTDGSNEIVIGAPGFGNSNGVVYLIPGNPDLQGFFNLGSTEAAPIQGLIIGLSQPAGTANYFGSSVSGLLGTSASGLTNDGDPLGDILIGSAGYALNSSRQAAGGVFLLEGAFTPLPTPISTAITSNIGVGDFAAPFSINATTPDALQIFILSGGSNTPGFAPFTDINPTTITVNGVGLPDPTTYTDEGDLDGDGIDDASFIFSPRSLLGLSGGVVTFTVAAQTTDLGNFPNRRYTGTASVTVTGPGGGGSGGLPTTRNAAFSAFGGGNTPALPYGERLVPSNTILRRLRYKPLRPFVAHRQFLPTNGFAFRNNNYFHPNKHSEINAYPTAKIRQSGGHGVYTLPRRVFSRGKFPNGLFVGKIKHKGPTI